MSSEPSMSIPVAPREISDLVYRIARVRGLDPGSAKVLGQGAATCAAHGGPAVDWVAKLASDVVPVSPHPDAPPINADLINRAHREGISLDRETFRSLERKAGDFLVSEASLDALADEAVVD